MKKLEEKLAEKTPSLVAFIHAAENDAEDIKHITEELHAIYGDKANIIYVDSSYNRPVIRKYNINAYPTWILFKEGQELMRESGAKTVNQLSQLIERAF